MADFFYVITLDQLGDFAAHVENDMGKVLWRVRTDDETGEFWPVTDGVMDHGSDVEGLERHLKEFKILPRSARLHLFRKNEKLSVS